MAYDDAINHAIQNLNDAITNDDRAFGSGFLVLVVPFNGRVPMYGSLDGTTIETLAQLGSMEREEAERHLQEALKARKATGRIPL